MDGHEYILIDDKHKTDIMDTSIKGYKYLLYKHSFLS
jgi:hypothetical protein